MAENVCSNYLSDPKLTSADKDERHCCEQMLRKFSVLLFLSLLANGVLAHLCFLASKVPQDLDAIVVGSGIGGLAIAVLLAKVGKKVLVLEQHDRAGGCCHTFTEGDFEFDVGIHYIGELLVDSPFRCVVDQLTNGQLQWDPLENKEL